MNRSSREADSLFISGVGGIAFLLGLSPMVNLVTSYIGAIFAVAAILGGLFAVVTRIRRGRSPTSAFLELAAIGLFTSVLLYGIMWYFISYMPSHGTMMFNFQLGGATPKPR